MHFLINFSSSFFLKADPKALCAYLCVIFMCGYKFRQSIAVVNYIVSGIIQIIAQCV